MHAAVAEEKKWACSLTRKALFTDVAAGSTTWAAFAASLKLPKPFEVADLLVKTTKPPNTPPPQALWHNIAPTLAVLMKIQEKFQKQLEFHSTYRSPLYNSGVGGVPRSQTPGISCG